MERAETLAKLHKDCQVLPPALSTSEKATHAKIFMSLVQTKPSQRPSSAELLDSGDIPVQAEDESLRRARRLLSDRNSQHRSQFINSLFSEPDQSDTPASTTGLRNQLKAMTLLEDVEAMSRRSPHDLNLQAVVKDRLTTIFQRHGAVERTDSPALFPYNVCYSSDDVVKFLNPNGKIMQLPYDLILPNAMLLARQTRREHKSFIFDDVYRVDHLREQPKIFGEANFDIVSKSGANLALCEAEILKVVDEIIDTFTNLTSAQMCYHVNHSRVLDAVLRFCDIDTTKWSAVKETISKLHTGEWTWAKVRHELRGPSIAVANTSLDELERFDFRDTLDRAVARIRFILKDTIDLESTFAHLSAVTTYLDHLNVQRKVYLSPLSSHNEKFYHGNILFQCLYDQKKRSVLAAGGRYDNLVRDHQPIASQKTHVHAVGFQLAWTGVCAGMDAYLQKLAKSKSKVRTSGVASAKFVLFLRLETCHRSIRPGHLPWHS